MPSVIETTQQNYQIEPASVRTDHAMNESGWHVLWTKSNFEKNVHDHLAKKNYDVFLPMISQQLSLKKGYPLVKTPMFKGYLFVRHAMDKMAYLDISNTKGIVKVLGLSWDRLAKIPEHEIQAIRKVTENRVPVTPYPELVVGTKVRIIRGVMVNTQGILVRSEMIKGTFVISVTLLQRSLAIKVDCADVVPI